MQVGFRGLLTVALAIGAVSCMVDDHGLAGMRQPAQGHRLRLAELGPGALLRVGLLLEEVGELDPVEREVALAPLVATLKGATTVHESEQSTYKDGLYAEQWMALQSGIPDVQSILPEHWRERG